MPSSIEEEIDPSTVAAEAWMLRAATNSTILILEGPSDEKVFINFIDADRCEIVIAHGKSNAMGALKILEDRSFSGVLCVVDRDFDGVLGGEPASQNLALTDHHDLGTTIFRSSAFDHVLYEYGSPGKIANAKTTWPNLREPIVLAAYQIGLLRLFSIKQSANLKFENARPVYVDRRTLEVDFNLLVKTIADHSKLTIQTETVKIFFGDWPISDHDPWQICCGHDLAEIFGKSLQTFFGSRRAVDVDLASIERALRLAYSFEDFRRSQLFAFITKWERKSSYACLRT
jgi:hypothetical protein